MSSVCAIAACCVTAKVAGPNAIDADRAEPVVLAATVNAVIIDPFPDPALVSCSQGAALTAVQPHHAALAVTLTDPVPPVAANEADGDDSVYWHALNVNAAERLLGVVPAGPTARTFESYDAPGAGVAVSP